MEKRVVLGKGLDALIPKRVAAPVPGKEFNYLPLELIRPGKYQPRHEMEEKELRELTSSIKEKGFIQPIVVRKIAGDDYEVVAGGRRYQAAKSLGLKEIPTITRNLDDKETLVFAIVENLQRKDLNPVDEAEAFRRLMNEFALTLENIAVFVGKDKTTVANVLRLLKLPDDIKSALKKGIITRGQARTILAAEGEDAQRKIFREIITEGLSVREVEKRVRKVSRRRNAVDPFVAEMEEKLQKAFGTKVRIFNKRNNKGRVVIEYYNLDDLERVIGRIV